MAWSQNGSTFQQHKHPDLPCCGSHRAFAQETSADRAIWHEISALVLLKGLICEKSWFLIHSHLVKYWSFGIAANLSYNPKALACDELGTGLKNKLFFSWSWRLIEGWWDISLYWLVQAYVSTCGIYFYRKNTRLEKRDNVLWQICQIGAQPWPWLPILLP